MKKILFIGGLLFGVYSYAGDYKYVTSTSAGAKVYLNTNPSYITKNSDGYTIWYKIISKTETRKLNLIINPELHKFCTISLQSDIPKNNYYGECRLENFWFNYDSEAIAAAIGDYLIRHYKPEAVAPISAPLWSAADVDTYVAGTQVTGVTPRGTSDGHVYKCTDSYQCQKTTNAPSRTSMWNIAWGIIN